MLNILLTFVQKLMFEKLIWVEKNSLSESFCNEVIEKFEKDEAPEQPLMVTGLANY